MLILKIGDRDHSFASRVLCVPGSILCIANPDSSGNINLLETVLEYQNVQKPDKVLGRLAPKPAPTRDLDYFCRRISIDWCTFCISKFITHLGAQACLGTTLIPMGDYRIHPNVELLHVTCHGTGRETAGLLNQAVTTCIATKNGEKEKSCTHLVNIVLLVSLPKLGHTLFFDPLLLGEQCHSVG